jgi:hypothetical protein
VDRYELAGRRGSSALASVLAEEGKVEVEVEVEGKVIYHRPERDTRLGDRP